MNENQSWNTIGEQIKDAVQGALDSGDFKQLNTMVAQTVNSALEEAGRQVRAASGDKGQADYVEPPEPSDQNRQNGQYNQNRRTNLAEDLKKDMKAAAHDFRTAFQTSPQLFQKKIKTRKVGSVSGVLYMVFGGIGTGLMTVLLLFCGIMTMISGLSSFFGGVALVAVSLLVLFMIMIHRGYLKTERLKRAERYVMLCNGKSYINLQELAMHVSRSERFLKKDIKQMLKMGIFPEGHLDQQETCLMLDDVTYREYITLERQRKAQELEEKSATMRNKKEMKVQMQQPEPVQEESETMDPELAKMVAQGQDCIRNLRELNDEIEGEVISNKLFRLENLLKEIFARIKEHPEQMPQMQKFMNYYLPTTLKLVGAYAEFDKVSAPGEDIRSAKAEIEKTLDTINAAFVELLNKLFRSSAFDAATDAQVLQSMLAREGLTREREFEPVKRQ